MEQRQHIRTETNGMEAYISDQAGLCRGILKDISRFGLCITEIPRKLYTDNGLFNVVILGRGYNFKLQLQEKWKTKNELTTMVGAGINDAPWDWTEMTIRQELKNRNI